MPDRSSMLPDNHHEGQTSEEHTEPLKNPAAVELGRRGGLKGGRARALSLSAERRSEVARDAAKARWGKK